MTAFSKTDAVGIDANIHRVITAMERNLPDGWGVDTKLCRFFGRVEPDKKDGVFRWSEGKDAVTLNGYDDKYSFQSYFEVNYPTYTVGNRNAANVSLYCHADASKISTVTSHTADAELMRDLKEIISRRYDGLNFEIIKVAYPQISFKINFEIRYYA